MRFQDYPIDKMIYVVGNEQNYHFQVLSLLLDKQNKMWTTGDVARTAYPHYPIFSTACCDVAHYDNDSRGIAELMYHKRDGGAIGQSCGSAADALHVVDLHISVDHVGHLACLDFLYSSEFAVGDTACRYISRILVLGQSPIGGLGCSPVLVQKV